MFTYHGISQTVYLADSKLWADKDHGFNVGILREEKGQESYLSKGKVGNGESEQEIKLTELRVVEKHFAP